LLMYPLTFFPHPDLLGLRGHLLQQHLLSEKLTIRVETLEEAFTKLLSHRCFAPSRSPVSAPEQDDRRRVL
jgi:hypothetical protein